MFLKNMAMSKRKTTFISIDDEYLVIKRIENGEKKQIIMNEFNGILIIS